ncbi:hypothetical protein OJF2_75340 [Aquisphaera giovannonii]|uniref:Uncharacterized protein n=1 Tax=Aquisphaera giovannonii TaxID=406548 RepID=A0A5B9WFB2_9BACT|nr:hypothetical protein [Aquisphaera giovannonii]QEH38924.1 hypothetical protein OJF2_75340 [Aquisphaera giovannonii]
MPKAYPYVGPKEIAARASGSVPGTVFSSADDLAAWVQAAETSRGRVTAMFVVDAAGRLRLADRRSEHVACAGGSPVLAAGEITLSIRAGRVVAEGVSNQSTGYCPEPESWPAVSAALAAAGVEPPEGYSTELSFRRCPRCDQINVIKDQLLECAVCGSALPMAWNLGPATEV